jgi:hypothetical protein
MPGAPYLPPIYSLDLRNSEAARVGFHDPIPLRIFIDSRKTSTLLYIRRQNFVQHPGF